jgi:predicted ATPase/HPt (histidine-containing phosphotransfer) domain-containing protein/PAS domain-containing protein
MDQTQSHGYFIVETLATSSRSVVQRARRNSDGATVVLKSFNQSETVPQQRKELERELQTLQALSSPLILRAQEVCEVDGRIALVLEDFGGQALEIPRGGLELSATLRIATQLVTALAVVHNRGFVHNDVKPSNLLVNRQTLGIKLIDFHLATSATRSRDAEGSELQGSLPYLSPERSGRMNREPDFRADYYSLGVLLFELASGQLPLMASDALGWAHAHLSKRPPLLSDVNPQVPRAFAELVAKLLEKDPDQRYQSSHGLLWDLGRSAEAWESTGQIPAFSLGARDVPQSLEISRELVGREHDLAQCRGFVADALGAGPRLLLLSGSVGVGKSSLLAELERSAVRPGTYFLTGNCDPQERSRPYSALVHALDGLVGRLLAASEAKLSEWRQRLLTALGPNASVMIDLVPRLVRITGPQPVAAELGPTESQHRLQHVIRQFVKVFASAEHPLLIALDDCQWLDSSTAEALVGLLTSPEVRHFAVLLAFRDGEVDADHVLRKLASRSERETGQAPRELVLKPLDSRAVANLLAKTLRVTPAEVLTLAELVREKTDGNPFFVGEVLGSLERQGILSLDPAAGAWRWDLGRARGIVVADNVGTLMAERIERLSPAAGAALSAAACFGNHFELAALAAALDLPGDQLSGLVWEAVAEHLVVPLAPEQPASALGESYVFQHTRVQQAAYARLVQDGRSRLHHRIGQRLMADAPNGASGERLFDVLHHLNLGRAGVSGAAERVALVELNLRATQRALKSAAFGSAEQHAAIAVALLDGASAEPELAFRALLAHAEAVFLNGDVARVEGLCARLFELAPNHLSRARVHVLRARTLEYLTRLPEAISEIRAGLALFGVVLPEAPAEIERGIGAGIGTMLGHLARVEVEELANLPTTESAETAMVLDLLTQVVPSAIQIYPPLFILAELMMFDLALTRGVTQASCKNFVDCGIIQASILGNPDVAYRLGRVAFKLLERYTPTPLESAVHFVFGGFVSHWKAHFSEGVRAHEICQRRGLELGDPSHVAYAWVHRVQRSILTGRPLEECASELREATSHLTSARMFGPLVGAQPVARALAHLSEVDDAAPAQGDAEATRIVLDSKNAQWGYSYGQCQTMVSFILGDLEAARRWQAFTQPFSLAAASLFSVPDYHLFEALIRVRDFEQAELAERPRLLEAIDQTLGKLKAWGLASPQNFGHKYELLAAERARIAGEPLQAVLAGYERAIVAAGEDFLHMRALVNELEAKLWLGLGDARHARPAFEAAYRLYAAWGATRKLRRLELLQPGWVRSATSRDVPLVLSAATLTTSSTTSALDADSIVKATQSISKEVEPQKLFSALMATLIENAGAQQGCLVLRSELDQHFYVEARADVDVVGAPTAQAEPLETAPGVCASVVRYVLRTREALALDDACARGNFQTDPYVVGRRVRSLLCVPILRQGEILGVLYLENNQTSHAFTRERVAILQVIASQAAISIDNAQLYASLERRVRARTQELAQKNRQIASMLDNMEQGVFTIDEQLRVQPGYSRRLEQILGTADIVGRSCVDLLFSRADLRADQVKALEAALRFGFGVESWLAGLNSAHLIKEFGCRGPEGELRFFEVDWNLICDDSNAVERMLVVVRDVTLMRQLKQTAHEKARETDIVAQLLETGLEAFETFCAASRQLLAENRATLESDEASTPAALSGAFRNLHTLKGHARLLSYTHLVDALHGAEAAYAGLRSEAHGAVDRGLMAEGLARVSELVSHYEEICARKLAPLAQARSGRVERSLREIAALVTNHAQDFPDGVLRRVRASLGGLDALSLADLVKETSRIVPSLAKELGRSVPTLIVSDEERALLTADWVQPMRDVLVQSFKNALYHGIEAPEERASSGKTREGHIRVDARRVGAAFEISIADDGRGLALGALRRRLNTPTDSDEAIAERIFEPGVSTAEEVGLVAGRGIGLDVVRSLLRARGGDVTLRFVGEEREGYRPCAFLVRLPGSAAQSDAARHRPSYPPAAAE